MSKTVPFQTIQFSISMYFSSIKPIDNPGATTSGQSKTGSDSNEGVLCIPQRYCITGTSPSDFFVSYLRHSLEVLPLCRGAISVFYSPQPTGQHTELNLKTVLFQILQSS